MVVVVVLVAVILIVPVVNSISSSCGSSKILTWTGNYKSGVGARADKYKLRARVGKYKLRARARGQAKGRGLGNTKTHYFTWKLQFFANILSMLVAIWEIFLYENYNSYRFSYKFAFIFFLSFSPFFFSFFPYKPKTRIRFLASWWSGNEKCLCFLFIASHALL